MGALEMLILGFGVIVGTVTLFDEPPDVMFDEIVVPKIMEERGFSSHVLGELLDDAGQVIYSHSNRPDFSLRLNYDNSSLSQFAAALNIREIVKSLHSLLAMVDGRVSLSFLHDDKTKQITAVVDLLQVSSGRVVHTSRIIGHVDEIEEIIEKIADFMIQHVTPYSYAVHLFQEAHSPDAKLLAPIETNEPQHYEESRSFIENWIVLNEFGAQNFDHWKWTDEDHFQTTQAFMFNLLGVINLREGKFKKAAQSLIHAIALDDSLPQPYINMARLLQIEENPQMALLYIEEAEELEPKYAITKLYSALAHHQMGRNEKALEDVQEALLRQSNLAFAHELRAKFLAESGADETLVTGSKRQANLSRWRQPNQLKALAF